MSNLPGFSKDLFIFLNDLADNNDRGWFQANKPRYEESVKYSSEPACGNPRAPRHEPSVSS